MKIRMRLSVVAVLVGGLLASLATLGATSPAQAQAGVVNTCAPTDISVALYGGSVSQGLVAGSTFLDQADGFCVQVIPTTDWSAMTIAEFQLFDALWIGNDDCAGSDASDFDVAAATVTTWEAAIDAGSVMVAGGDYDFHYNGNQSNAIAVTQALVTEISDAAAPGLVLQAGCYAVSGAPWFQNLGGTFTGLGHANSLNGDPGPDDVYLDHEFNMKYSFDSSSYNFSAACHGAISITPGSPVENYQLQPLFDFRGNPCFMFSDAAVAPTFTQDIGDTVFCDTDGNGVFDAGEGLAGVTVTLTDAAGASKTATTGADGNYIFVDEVIGTYTVAVDVATLPADCNVSSVDPDGGTDASAVITTTIGSTDNLAQDFGFSAPTTVPTATPVPTPAPSPTPAPPVVVVPPTPATPDQPVGPTGPLTAPDGPELSVIEEAFVSPDIGALPEVSVPVAEVPATPATEEVLGINVTTTELAHTGAHSNTFAMIGLLLISAGFSLAGTVRRIRSDES